jgi:hypothetical protein
MSEDRDQEERLADALLEEDRRRGVSPDRRRAGEGESWLTALLEREEAAELRVRRLAIAAWRAVVALVPLLGVSVFMIRVVADGWIRDAVRTTVLVIGVFALLAIFLAVLTTVAWLFRSRRASLAVVERRLAALEELLTRRV